jgi:hypothetical protein
MNPIKERRLGKVTIEASFFDPNGPDSNLTALRSFFADFIVVDCRYDYASNSFDYLGFSSVFEPVTQGQVPRTYPAEAHIAESVPEPPVSLSKGVL